MKLTVCELNNPPIKAFIQQHYVPWYCDVDSSSQWYAYAYGLGSFTLPLIAVIDPLDSSRFLNRSTGVQSPNDFYTRLLNPSLGDVDHSGLLTLLDAIISLQVIAGLPPAAAVYPDADVNGDGKIGVAEANYILNDTAR